MTCKYCAVGYWVATFLALGAFVFCTVLTQVYGWELSEYCWLLKGVMLSIGLVLATGLWQVEKRVSYVSAWVLSLVGLGIAVWQNFFTDAVCTLDCGKPIFMLGNISMTPLVTAMTLFAILFVMTSMMIIRNKQ
jgi:hypothetical protein